MKKPFQQIPFFIRLFNWEFWPFNLVYIPVFTYWALLALRARSLLFFSAANPGIPTGGLIGESKLDILDKVPDALKPFDFLVEAGMTEADILEGMAANKLVFPLIAKPDVGERGLLVRKLNDMAELKRHLEAHPVGFLLQEYIDYEEEVSIFHFWVPGEATGQVSSVTLKEYLQVSGNGRDDLETLIRTYPRARLQMDSLRKSHGDQFGRVLPAGEKLIFHTIGNHSKGCKFINGNHRISDKLRATFDRVNAEIEGVYYCRYDIKCKDWESLEQGRDFKILEVNGVKSEPTHIYDPNYPIGKFYRDIIWHWNIIYKISRTNNKLGVKYMRFGEAWVRLKELIRYHKRAQA